MRKANAKEIADRAETLADAIMSLAADLKFNREYPIDAPNSPVMFVAHVLENAASNLRQVEFYYESLSTLRLPRNVQKA